MRPACAVLLAALELLLVRRGGGQDAAFVMLTEISPRIAIRNLTLKAPPGSSHIACDESDSILIFQPSFNEHGGGHEHIPGESAVEVAFDVQNMVMGHGAGRAVVLVDDEAVAECPAERCRVRLSAIQLHAVGSISSGHCEGAMRPTNSVGSCSVRSNRIQVMLVAPEPDLPAHPVALGVQRSFSFALVQAAEENFAPESATERESLARRKQLLGSELISWSYCMAPEALEHVQDSGKLSVDEHELEREDESRDESAGLFAGGGLQGQSEGQEPARLATEGESSEVQHLFMKSLMLSHREVRSVLEIGFHAGLSARAFLSARADVSMVSFDIGRHGHEEQFWRTLTASFPARHTLILADSLTGVPAFHKHNPTRTFDLFYIDGGHTYAHAKTDMLNCARIARQRRRHAGEEGGGGALVLMDDLTPWVYWGVGPDRAWHEAIESGMIELVVYYREVLEEDAAGQEIRQGAGDGVSSGLGRRKWVDMSKDQYRALVADYTARRNAFNGSDEEAEIIKVWALARFVDVGEADDVTDRDGDEFVVETRLSWPQGPSVWDGGTEQHAGPAWEGGAGYGEDGVIDDGGREDEDGVAVCVLGQESELEALIVSLRSVLLVLPTWKVKIYSPPNIAAAVRHRLMPVVALSRGYGRVEFATLDEFSDEDFTRNASTHVLWGSHQASETGRVRVLHQGGRGVHYDTLFKTRRFWESVPAEHILIFQADSLLCEHTLWTIHEFIKYDYVGSPWRQEVCPADNDKSVSICLNDYLEMVRSAGFHEHEGYALPAGQGGNGGLSFRRRSKMLEIVSRCRHSASMDWNEDVFFSFPCPPVSISLPSVEIASRFGVESGPFYGQASPSANNLIIEKKGML